MGNGDFPLIYVCAALTYSVDLTRAVLHGAPLYGGTRRAEEGRLGVTSRTGPVLTSGQRSLDP
jgi:hypothetical protein